MDTYNYWLFLEQLRQEQQIQAALDRLDEQSQDLDCRSNFTEDEEF